MIRCTKKRRHHVRVERIDLGLGLPEAADMLSGVLPHEAPPYRRAQDHLEHQERQVDPTCREARVLELGQELAVPV